MYVINGSTLSSLYYILFREDQDTHFSSTIFNLDEIAKLQFEQNPPICDPPLYIDISFDLIMQFLIVLDL